MKNQCISHSSLARCLCASDFFDDKNLKNDDYRKKIIEKAFDAANDLFASGISLDRITVKNKTAYRIPSLSEKIILRKCVENIKYHVNISPKHRCVENIKYHVNISPKHRNVIIRELVSYLKEGTPYRIYKLDIKSFFESLCFDDIKNTLTQFKSISTHTKNIILAYLEKFNSKYGDGIPRGVEFSPAISELVLKEFDKAVHYHKDVFYFSRFVDDIIIITSGKEDQKAFTKWLSKKLPNKLIFNYNKKKIIDVDKGGKSTNSSDKTVAHFDFLGYEFFIIDTQKKNMKDNYRKVNIDISVKKVSTIKSKISKSLYNHYIYNDFPLLYDRLCFLVSNRNLVDKDRKRTIPTGIYYNYCLISPESEKLQELDNFLKFSILSSNSRLGKLTRDTITSKQRKRLLKLSFVHGFDKRVYKKFSPNRLKEITAIW